MRALRLVSIDREMLREVWALAWPVVVSMLSYNAMLVADALFVGQLGTTAVAALGLAGTGAFVVRAFGNGLLGGVRVSAAQALGAGDPMRARRFAWQGVWLAAALGLFAWSVLPFGAAWLGLLGAQGPLLAPALGWWQPVVAAAPLGFLGLGLGGWLQSQGDSRSPMRAEIAGNAVNIALDAVLVHGLGPVPAFGVAGAGWATAAGITVAAAMQVWAARAQLRSVSAWPEPVLLRQVWRLGAPMGVQWLLDVGSYAVFAAILAGAGEAHLAGHVLVVRVVCVSFLPGYGVSQAVGVLVGQAVGARRPDRADAAWRAGTALAVGIMSAWGVVFLAFPEALLSAFDAQPEVLVIGVQLLAIGAAFQVLDAVATVAGGALTGAGDTRFLLWVSVLGAWGVKLPLGWWLARAHGMGAAGAWLGITAELLLLTLILVWRARGLSRTASAPQAPAALGMLQAEAG